MSEKKDTQEKMEIEPEKSQEINQLQEIMYSIKLGDLNYEESLALAEKYKAEGNTFFGTNKFIEALEKYTQAIDLKVETKNNAIYYSNRAYVHLKLENFGSAIQDANTAIKIDPEFAKAYHRRALAYFSLRKYDEALKDFLLLKTKFNDKKIDEYIDRTRNAKKRKNFFEAFSSEGRGKALITIEGLLKTLKPSTSYTGPVFPKDGKIDDEWVKSLIERMKDMDKKKTNSEKYIDKVYLLQKIYR